MQAESLKRSDQPLLRILKQLVIIFIMNHDNQEACKLVYINLTKVSYMVASDNSKLCLDHCVTLGIISSYACSVYD